MAARRSGPFSPSIKVPLRADKVAGPGRQALEDDAVALGLLLDALGLEVVDDDRREILAREVRVGGRASALGGLDLVDQFLLARRQHAMGRQALDRERAGDADRGHCRLGLVVEIFDFGAGGDRGVDLLLAGDAGLPPFGVKRLPRLRPGVGPLGKSETCNSGAASHSAF